MTNTGSLKFDWHCDVIARDTHVDRHYKNTQNVRRYLKKECGGAFKFDRGSMAWIKNGDQKTMGDVADEWYRRRIE